MNKTSLSGFRAGALLILLIPGPDPLHFEARSSAPRHRADLISADKELQSDPQGPKLWIGLPSGPHRVGYRRIFDDRITVDIWYPTGGDGPHLRFRDYLYYDAPAWASFLAKTGVHPATIDSLFNGHLFAISSPPPEEGEFPLILIAQGNGQDVADQVVLCEYLASLGLVVASAPSPTLRTPLRQEDQVGHVAEMQATDLATAVGLVSNALSVDTNHIGLVGHSLGARAALLLAMRDPRVRAIVSLDGGIGTATATTAFRRAPSFRPDARLPPILHFYEELDGFMKPDFHLLNGLHFADLKLEPTHAMHHVHFTTYGFAAVAFSDIATATRATPGTARDVLTVAESTATFLRRNLR